jgi:hypothetical protein
MIEVQILGERKRLNEENDKLITRKSLLDIFIYMNKFTRYLEINRNRFSVKKSKL